MRTQLKTGLPRGRGRRLLPGAATLLVLSSCLAAPSLRAAIISQTSTPLDESILTAGSFADPLTDSQTVDLTFSDYEFTFDQFDPSLGTLTDIRVSYYFSYTASATANSQIDDTHPLTLGLNYSVSFNTDGGAFDGNGTGNGAGADTAGEALSASGSMSGQDRSVFYDPIFTDAQGSGTFSIFVPITDRAWNAQITGYFTDYEIKRDAGAYYQVDYEYTAIPEPATLSFIFLAAGGLLFAKRYRAW
jgi:hypothetical protein